MGAAFVRRVELLEAAYGHDACGVGFIADTQRAATRETVALALRAVAAMAHRGARAADGRTGDGAGILLDIPRALIGQRVEASGIAVDRASLAVVGLFLSRDPRQTAVLRATVESAVRSAGVAPLLWRTPPADESVLGPLARETAPRYEQLVVDAGTGDRADRMRRVYDRTERAIAPFGGAAALVSASASSVVYKALLSSGELESYYADLRDPLCVSQFAVFHQRFSTNTAPSWRLVQPFRHIAHNGEINTIAGNRGWLRARGVAVPAGGSDSHDLNIAVDALLDAGFAIDDAIDLLLGAAVDPSDERLRSYYEAHLPTVEHWDGPAAIAFYHAGVVGAALDRSGFRPLRWSRTAGGRLLAASEAGVLADDPLDPIVARGRLGPGERIVVRLTGGEIVEPDAFREERRRRADYRAAVRAWSFAAQNALAELPPATPAQLRRFAYTREDERDLVGAMASSGAEPVASMGDDAAPAFLMGGEPLAHYLRQRFAQVTNPPIDALREGFVFDMRTYVGCGGIHGEIPSFFETVALEHAIVDEPLFDALEREPRLHAHRIDLVLGPESLSQRLDAIAEEASAAVRLGASLIVLDNRAAGPAVDGALAAGVVHQGLIAAGLRMQASIAVADGYARDAHGVAAIVSSGANVVVPWLALRLAAATDGGAAAFLTAVRDGLLKIMAKLGICTLRSYVGAQTFEALGLAREVVAKAFPAMNAHVPCVGFAQLEADLRAWYADAQTGSGPLPDRGHFRLRRDGVRRAFDPSAIKMLRASAISGDVDAYLALSDAMEQRAPVTVRDLLATRSAASPAPLDCVEPESAILASFTTAAMSLGALGPEAHEAVARAAVLAGARSNSGEGGEEAERYSRESPARSAIKQVASARFGVGVTYLASADEIEIKIAQGSKPGEGGQIPGHKVTHAIARLRGAVTGRALVSPPPHHDIYSIEDLAQLIYDLRRAAPHARIAVKLVAQGGIGQVACGVAKAGADTIHISGHDGGTGASPLGSIKRAGLPWELGLVEAHDLLVRDGLRDRVTLRVDGGFKSGRDVVIAALLGADQFGFGSALLVALGCIYARQCHKNTCPVGIATQDAALRAKFAGTPEQGAQFLAFVARDVRRRLADLGLHSLRDARGRRDLLQQRFLGSAQPAADVRALLAPEPGSLVAAGPAPAEDPHLDERIADGQTQSIGPWDRAVGARIAHQYATRRAAGVPCAPLEARVRGTAGQSFGAFLTDGISLVLDGDANDYVGKSMEGGKIVVTGTGDPREPAIGNACFYGARGGSGFIGGVAGERFGVRNSGAQLVAEGAGDHACEYMTAGAAVLLGPVGRNAAAGMSGGVLWILDDADVRPHLGPCDMEAVRVGDDDPHNELLQRLLCAHLSATGSTTARELLAAWPRSATRFWKLAAAAELSGHREHDDAQKIEYGLA